MNIPDHISESLKTVFGFKKLLNSLMRIRIRDPKFFDRGSRVEKIRIRDKHLGSATLSILILCRYSTYSYGTVYFCAHSCCLIGWGMLGVGGGGGGGSSHLIPQFPGLTWPLLSFRQGSAWLAPDTRLRTLVETSPSKPALQFRLRSGPSSSSGYPYEYQAAFLLDVLWIWIL